MAAARVTCEILMAHRGSQKGVTLIELIVVVAMIGIIAAFAIPSYQDSIRKSNRAQAMAALMEGAQQMEVFYTRNGRYCETAATCNSAPAVFQTQIPRTGTAYYTLAATNVTSTTFTLSATPTGTMAGDACGTLSIDQAGTQSRSGTLDASQCWRR